MKQVLGPQLSFRNELHYLHFLLLLTTCLLSSHHLPFPLSYSSRCFLPLPDAVSLSPILCSSDPCCYLPLPPAAQFGSGSTGSILISLKEFINLGFMACLNTTGASLVAGNQNIECNSKSNVKLKHFRIKI